jgi:hypothetical protein
VSLDNSPKSLFLLANDAVFSEMLAVVGHTPAEMTEILPLFRQQFLMTFFFALVTYLEEDQMGQFLERLKAGDTSVFPEITRDRSQEEMLGSYMYAFEEVYGGYAQVVGPVLSEEQKQRLVAIVNQTISQGTDG